MRDYVARFGFGSKTGIDLPGEIPGLLRPLEQWREGSVASVAMGHEIGATPLQMAVATAAAANGGYWVKPRLVDAVREPSGQIRRLEPSERRRIVSAETAARLRSMMEQTVLRGTGRLAAVSGYRSGGKTGTAQMIDPETRAYSHDLYMAGYAGFAPLNDPAIAACDRPRGAAGRVLRRRDRSSGVSGTRREDFALPRRTTGAAARRRSGLGAAGVDLAGGTWR